MVLSSEEKQILKSFDGITFTKVQLEAILRRSITRREWRKYNRNYKNIFTNIAKQAANVAAKKIRKKVKPSNEQIEILKKEKYTKIIKNIAIEAAKSVLLKKIKSGEDK